MHRMFTILSLTIAFLSASYFEVNSELSLLNNFIYETPQGRQMKVPEITDLVVIAFEKDTGALVNDYLNTQDPFYMSKHRMSSKQL